MKFQSTILFLSYRSFTSKKNGYSYEFVSFVADGKYYEVFASVTDAVFDFLSGLEEPTTLTATFEVTSSNGRASIKLVDAI